MLLAPAGNRSLASIGKLYGTDLNKLEVSNFYKTHMDLFYHTHKENFVNYALQDSLITLKHANEMENFNFTLQRTDVPLTLSGLGKTFVLFYWRNVMDYNGYQIDPNLLIGKASEIQTPKGLTATKNVGVYMSHFINNYKGGRNESFCYGVDRNTLWFDYDLVSAYTTAMAYLGDPKYEDFKLLSKNDFDKLKTEDFMNGYFIIQTKFIFPDTVKYPSIPVMVDDTTTVYPLTGGPVFLTGPEYLLARAQKCGFDWISAIKIPTYPEKPFYEIIKEIQAKRREFPKGSVKNLLYKEIGNSIYGNTVTGMADKKRYDPQIGKTVRVEAGKLSNPILASLTTGLIRSVIGECLHNIKKLGGIIVSVTTDGFITNIPDLESKFLDETLFTKDETLLLRWYITQREKLSGSSISLELKTSGTGIIFWTTRGQLGINSRLKAMTGFQNHNLSKDELIAMLIELIKSEDKELNYVMKTLRSGKTILKHGGHVTPIERDQIFRVLFDNRRQIIEPENDLNPSEDFVLLDSKPWNDVRAAREVRKFSRAHNLKKYHVSSSGKKIVKKVYNNPFEKAVRVFLRGLYSPRPLFNLNPLRRELKTYDQILKLINGYDPDYKLNKHKISYYKGTASGTAMVEKSVPRTIKTEDFGGKYTT